jgi:hypothetical protein
MDPFGLRSVEVRPGEDHDGDPAIFVEAQYDLSATPECWVCPRPAPGLTQTYASASLNSATVRLQARSAAALW